MARDFFSIGDLAQRFGVSAESLRNWERLGKIPAARRTAGSHRRYDLTHIRAIEQMMIPVRAEASRD